MRVLLSNDDGPPGEHSPFIFPFADTLAKKLGWEVYVVIPHEQKSWYGKCFFVNNAVKCTYYYPRYPDGLGGVTEEAHRAPRDGEAPAWILADSTPAAAVNLGLHNIVDKPIDMVLSGPNYGRNTSSAFSLASGTIGCALSAALSGKNAIAVSFGFVDGFKKPPEPVTNAAVAYAVEIVRSITERNLWDNFAAPAHVDIFSLNIPLVESIVDAPPPVVWTNFARTSYGSLFKQQSDASYAFSPDFKALVESSTLPRGSDGGEINRGNITLTPMQAAYQVPPMTPGDLFDVDLKGL